MGEHFEKQSVALQGYYDVDEPIWSNKQQLCSSWYGMQKNFRRYKNFLLAFVTSCYNIFVREAAIHSH